MLLLEGLSACLTSKVGKVLTAVTGHGIVLTLSLLKEFSSIFSVSASARGFFRVCKNSAAFLLRSACSCFSFDSLEACASFSLAAAANLSSSFCFAKKDS